MKEARAAWPVAGRVNLTEGGVSPEHSRVMRSEFHRRAARSYTALAAALAGLSGCSEGPFLHWEEYVTNAHGERFLGAACFQVSEGASTGGGVGPGAGGQGAEQFLPGYALEHVGVENGVDVAVKNPAGEVLVTRHYANDFLAARGIDEVTAELDGGSVRIVYWGGRQCDQLRVPDDGEWEPDAGRGQ